MKKTFIFFLLFSFLLVDIIPITPVYAGRLTTAIKAVRGFKAPLYKVPKPRITPRPKIAPAKIPSPKVAKIHTTPPVKIGNTTAYGQRAAAINRNQARVVKFPKQTTGIKVDQGAVNKFSGNVKQTGKLFKKKNFRGGKHADMKKPVGDKLDSHHMPDRKADIRVSSTNGPAIQMERLDHRATSSWGNSYKATRYRMETKNMINAGRHRDAVAREIRDVRRASLNVSGNRKKYNTAMQEMLRYAKKSKILTK